MSKKIKVTDFQPDDKNMNLHTQYGMSLLEKSVEKVGIIESITVSADDKVISGNARQEIISRKFGDVEPIIVETDGKRPVILKRTDINSNTEEFHRAAILANTVSKHNIDLDLNLIQEIAVEQFDIDIEELGVTVMPDELYDDDFKEEGGGTMETKPETTGMIAISLNDDEHLEWLSLKEKIGIPQDKKAFLHILNTYSYDDDSL